MLLQCQRGNISGIIANGIWWYSHPSTAEHKLSLCVPSSEQGMYTVDSIANGYGNIFILILRQCSRYLYAIHQIVHTQMIAALPGCKLMKAVFSRNFTTWEFNSSCAKRRVIKPPCLHLDCWCERRKQEIVIQCPKRTEHRPCFLYRWNKFVIVFCFVRGIRIVGRDNGKKTLSKLDVKQRK